MTLVSMHVYINFLFLLYNYVHGENLFENVKQINVMILSLVKSFLCTFFV